MMQILDKLKFTFLNNDTSTWVVIGAWERKPQNSIAKHKEMVKLNLRAIWKFIKI